MPQRDLEVGFCVREYPIMYLLPLSTHVLWVFTSQLASLSACRVQALRQGASFACACRQVHWAIRTVVDCAAGIVALKVCKVFVCLCLSQEVWVHYGFITTSG